MARPISCFCASQGLLLSIHTNYSILHTLHGDMALCLTRLEKIKLGSLYLRSALRVYAHREVRLAQAGIHALEAKLTAQWSLRSDQAVSHVPRRSHGKAATLAAFPRNLRVASKKTRRDTVSRSDRAREEEVSASRANGAQKNTACAHRNVCCFFLDCLQ